MDALLRRKHALETDLQREHNRLEKQRGAHHHAQAIESIERMIGLLREELNRLDDRIEQPIQAHPHLANDRR